MEALNVHALGPSGCGKTVFMASLYERLRLERENMTFYVKTDNESATSLLSVYAQVKDPNQPWPPPTQGVKEWQFSINIHSKKDNFEALSIRYIDYPGGVLTNPAAIKDKSVENLINNIQNANALLILLDGVAIKALMRNEKHGDRYLNFELARSLDIAQQSRSPIHFVITKWDLLEGEYTLGQVKQRLLLEENIKDIIKAKKNQDSGATIRLIPTSSVGMGYVTPMPNGGMEKTGATSRPWNIEIPLAAVLPDFFQYAARERAKTAPAQSAAKIPATKRAVEWLSDKAKSQKAAEHLTQAALRALVKAANGNPTLVQILKYNPEMVVRAVDGAMMRLVSIVQEKSALGLNAYIDKLYQQREAVTSQEDAFSVVERNLVAILSQFEIRYPESVLLGGLNSTLRMIEK